MRRAMIRGFGFCQSCLDLRIDALRCCGEDAPCLRFHTKGPLRIANPEFLKTRTLWELRVNAETLGWTGKWMRVWRNRYGAG